MLWPPAWVVHKQCLFLFFWNTYVELFLLMRTLMHLKCYRPRSSLLAGLPRKNEWAGFYVDQTHHKQPQNKQKKRHKKQNPQHNHNNNFCLLTRTNHKQQPKKKSKENQQHNHKILPLCWSLDHHKTRTTNTTKLTRQALILLFYQSDPNMPNPLSRSDATDSHCLLVLVLSWRS